MADVTLQTLIRDSLWAIYPPAFNELMHRAYGGAALELGAEATAAAGGRMVTYSPRVERANVAVIPIHGVITKRGGFFGTGTDQLQAQLEQARLDERITAVVLDVDSPGGTVNGVPEAAAAIRRTRNEKPVLAIADSYAASAAYWLAAQATELIASDSAEVGSIGVFSAHSDISTLLERIGEKVTLISAGKHKVEGNPFEPLAADAHAEMQRRVNEVHDRFVADVARGRGVDETIVRSMFGEGRMFSPARARARGMVDRQATLEEVIRTAHGAAPALPRRSQRTTAQWQKLFGAKPAPDAHSRRYWELTFSER